MSDISFKELRERFLNGGNTAQLLEAAATVANSIHVGLGFGIQGSLMEKSLRDALGLKKGEMVNFRRSSSAGADRGD